MGKEDELQEELSIVRKEFMKLKTELAELKVVSGEADIAYLKLCKHYSMRGKIINILTEKLLEVEKKNAALEKKLKDLQS